MSTRIHRLGSRYSRTAITLHWLIALLICANLWIGWWMVDAIKDTTKQAVAFQAFQLHKSLGVTVLLLSLLRLMWRLFHKPPALPAAMSRFEKAAARAAHVCFYLVMIGLSLSGWIYVSSGWNSDMATPFEVPTIVFGLVEWPHIARLATLSNHARALVADISISAHALLASGTLGLLALHILAALKHHFKDRDDVLVSMLPLLVPRRAKLPTINENEAS